MPFSKLFKKRNSLPDTGKSLIKDGSSLNDTNAGKRIGTFDRDFREVGLLATNKPDDNVTLKEVTETSFSEGVTDSGNDIPGPRRCSFPARASDAVKPNEEGNAEEATQRSTIRSSSFKGVDSRAKLPQKTRRRKCDSESAASDITDDDEGFDDRIIQFRQKDLETVIGRCVNRLLQDSIATAVKGITVDNLYQEVRRTIYSRNNSESSESSECSGTVEQKQHTNSVFVKASEEVKNRPEDLETAEALGNHCGSMTIKNVHQERIDEYSQKEKDVSARKKTNLHLDTKNEETSNNLSEDSCEAQSLSDISSTDVNTSSKYSLKEEDEDTKCSLHFNSKESAQVASSLDKPEARDRYIEFTSFISRDGEEVIQPTTDTGFKKNYQSIESTKLTFTVESCDEVCDTAESITESIKDEKTHFAVKRSEKVMIIESDCERSSEARVPSTDDTSFCKSELKSEQSQPVREPDKPSGYVTPERKVCPKEKEGELPETNHGEESTPLAKSSAGNEPLCKKTEGLVEAEVVSSTSVALTSAEVAPKAPAELPQIEVIDAVSSLECEMKAHVTDVDLIRMSSDDASECEVGTNATETLPAEQVCDLGENLPQQSPITEEEKKVNWKVGYLHVKLPQKSRGKGHFKAWKKRCVAIQLDEFANDLSDPCLMISLYSGESGNAKKHGASFWKSVSSQRAIVYRSSSSSRAYAFTVSDDKVPVIHLAADSESDSQEWMTAMRAILWPPSPVMQLEKMLNGREYEISLIDNEFAYRAGLLGMYGYLTITPKKLILVHPNQGYVIQEWYLNTVDKFELRQQTKIEDVHKVLAMTTCSDSSTGRGEILIYCREALSLLQSLASTIHQILTHHSKQEGGKYQKELEEMAEWFLPPAEPEDYYKVPTRQVKSLLDIPNFIFNKPLTPVASLACTRGISMEAQLKPIIEMSNSTRASQDSGISAGTDDFLNSSMTSFMVGGGPFTGKSSDSELSDSYTPPLSPVVKVRNEKRREKNSAAMNVST